MVQVAQEQEWPRWQRQQLNALDELITLADSFFATAEAVGEESRRYGIALLAHSIECARAIHLCISKNLSGPAFSLVRVQYEGALRGHIVIHEIELDELNELLLQIQQWQQDRRSQQPAGKAPRPPGIEIQERKWWVIPETKAGRHLPKKRPLQCETAKIWQESVNREMRVLHDLTHSGLTHAVLMLDEGEYSAKNQTLLLCFAQKSVMFAIMTRPGVQQKYYREIGQRAAAIIKQWSIFEPHILIPTEEMVVSGRTSMTPGSTATGS